MKPEEFKLLVKTLSTVVDQRAKTTETIFKAEMASSERRLREEIRTSEERTKKELRREILEARAEAHADNSILNANVVREVGRLKKRVSNLEEHTGITDPTKN